MSYASRLRAQNERIQRYVAAESTRFGDEGQYITEARLWSIWMRQVEVGGEESRTELDEFQECVPSPDLARKLYSAIKTISILICIDWHEWHEFADRFCRLTQIASLDDLEDVDRNLPYNRGSLENLLFPDDEDYAEGFFQQQYVFLPLVLEEGQKFRSYQSEYRLPLLDDSVDRRGGHGGRIVPVKVTTGHFRFARGGEFNSTAHPLRRKRFVDSPDIELEIQNLAILRSTEEMSDRIMRHTVALRIGPEYNIFFDEAVLDLESMLDGDYHPYYPESAMNPQSLVGEAWYLAGALNFLHHRLVDRRTRLLCCHTDLTPANILIVKSTTSRVGKWMLSDFGISVIKTEPRSGWLAANLYSDDPQPPISITRATRRASEYQPPEVVQDMLADHGGSDGRKGDIWSFGCILTKLLLFSLGGARIVKRLQTIKQSDGQTDLFFSSTGTGLRPNHKVKTQLKGYVIQIGNRQGLWVFEWQQMIFDRMLLISPSQRREAKHIQECLDSIWRQAPAANSWHNVVNNSDVPRLPPTSIESPGRPASPVSLPSSMHPSAVPPSTSEPSPAGTPKLNTLLNPFATVREPSLDEIGPLSPGRSGSNTGTVSSRSVRGIPIGEIDVRNALPQADDIAICSDPVRVLFWNGQNMIPYSREHSIGHPERPLFFRETWRFLDAASQPGDQGDWFAASLSGSYVALARCRPSSVQVKVTDLENGRDLQSSTDWPPFRDLKSVCISSRGSIALIYDDIVTFRCTGVGSHLQNSSWRTTSENICSASFSQDGNRFYLVSWTKLWIGSIVKNKWVLRVSGNHNLSAHKYLSFKPYLVPFTTREAVLAHNPAEKVLQYLEADSSIKVDLGEGLIRVALSEDEDVLIYARKLQRGKRFYSESFYGLSWRSIGRSQAGAMSLGAENEIIDLNITVERNKKFSITSSIEQGIIIVVVATTRGEIRKCQLM